MTESEGFVEVADRSIMAARAVNAAKLHENGCFFAYHGFESIGGAFCRSIGVEYHPMSHPKKIKTFVSSAKGKPYGRTAAQLAIELTSLRNKCLYPLVTPSGTVSCPKDLLTPPQAERLLGRTAALVVRVKRDL